MGVYAGESIAPGERKPFRIIPPGSGAVGPISDPVYISIPYDQFGGPPGKCRWAILDDSGKVIASNDKDPNNPNQIITTPGLRIVAHAGAYLLSVENQEPVGPSGRVVGSPTFEWKYQ